jgi:exopolysaccharide biosynthesis protein
LRLLLTLGVLLWQPVRLGVWRGEMSMAKSGPLSSVRAIAVRLDPARVRFVLDTATRDDGMAGDWTIERIPAAAVAALNTGQFRANTPWGWVVQDGAELRPPGAGPLVMSFVVDSSRRVSLVTPDELLRIRHSAVTAFQSYPALLVGEGTVPSQFEAPDRGVDLDHRDSRLAIGTLVDGSVVVVLTRFTGLGRAGETLPWGPTVPEMAAFMKSLGCRRAMLLDGGLSSQLALRGPAKTLSRWRNWRPVPLGLLVFPSEGRNTR